MTRRDVGALVFTARMAETLETMKEEIQLLRGEREKLLGQLAAKDGEIEKLRHRLDKLCRHVFGRRSEQLDPNQLRLAFAMLQAEQTEAPLAPLPEPEAAAQAPKRGHGRKRLPDTLPRERIEIHPSPEERKCEGCGQEKQLMKGAEAITERLDYVPASLVVREEVRFKYCCPRCEDPRIVCAPLLPAPIEKGRPGPGLLAHVATSKYADHLPLNRLEGIFERHGLRLSRSTTCDWIAGLAFVVRPIVAEVRRQVLAAFVIQSDDTTVRVLDPEAPHGAKTGRLWAYRGEPGSVFFAYTETRSGDGPTAELAGFKGFLQVDAYAGYNAVVESNHVIRLGCLAHVRRYFYDLKATEPKAVAALGWIGQLYAVEREATKEGLDHEARKALRLKKAEPHLRGFYRWLEAQTDVVPGSAIGEAIGYALNQREPVARYLEDGRLEIDNNDVERCMRRVAVGRKNWEFAGSDEGAHRAATIYSLVESCREAKVDVFRYLRDVIERVSTHPASRVAELTPRHWKPPPPV